MKEQKSKITVAGTKKDGYIITIFGKDGFTGDIAITFEEILLLKTKLNKIK